MTTDLVSLKERLRRYWPGGIPRGAGADLQLRQLLDDALAAIEALERERDALSEVLFQATGCIANAEARKSIQALWDAALTPPAKG